MWNKSGNALVANFEFENFTTAFAFMTQVAFVAEKQNHHPNWTNVYNLVSFKLSTHDTGNSITQKDYALAEAISALYKKYV